jgi:hypothetical protein
MTDIDPEKLLSLRQAWTDASRASNEAYTKAQDLGCLTAEAESDFMAYAKFGEEGLQQERQMREDVVRFGLQQGAMAGNYGRQRANDILGAKIRG